MKISAAIITFNEENNITDCIKSVLWCDEIIILDSNSTDKTCELAKIFTDKIFLTDMNNYSEKRKLAISYTKNDWVLFIDADERVTEELKEEICKLEENTDVFAYEINRKNYCLGKLIQYCGINPDYHIRLFNKNYAEIINRKIHEGIAVRAKTDRLKNHIIHYTYRNLYQMIEKVNIYSTLEAEENYEKNKPINKIEAVLKPISTFIRIFLIRKGYKDGLEGFYLSFCYSMVNFLSQLKLLKLKGKF